MSVIVYNGVACSFVHTKQFGEEDVYLGPDVAVRRYTATWELTIHRQTTGTALGDAAGVIGPDGVFAWQAVHDAMMTPRSAFRWVQGNRVLFDLAEGGPDAVGLPGDCELGPKPLSCNIIGFNGNGSLVAQYTLQWALPNPCGVRNGKMGILAHVWKVDDDLDAQFFMTRTYMGVIRLDPRVVGVQAAPNGIHPDRIRGLLLPPRSRDMHRVNVQMRTLEDGYTFAYKVVDKQPSALVNHKYVARIEAEHRVEHSVPSIPEVAGMEAGFAKAVTDIITNVAGMAEAAVVKGLQVLGVPLAGFPTTIEQVMAQARQYAYGSIPKVTHTITATAYGYPATEYVYLAQASRVVCLFRAMKGALWSAAPDETFANFGGSFVQHDRTDPRAVQCVLTVTRRPPAIAPAPAPDPGILGILPGVRPAPLDLAPDALTARRWAEGRNAMPTIAGNQLVPRDITGPNGQAVPVSLQQLIYGGQLHTGGVHPNAGWGWTGPAFAPDLMSRFDVDVRSDDDLTPRGQTQYSWRGANQQLEPLALALIQGVQDPCAYKKPITFVNRPPLQELP